MKVAYIDHKSNSDFAKELRGRGIDLVVSDTLKEFERGGHSLENFLVLLFHPGTDYQHEIGMVKKKYPNLALAIVTAPSSQVDYMTRKRDLLIFSYDNIDEIIEFIHANQ